MSERITVEMIVKLLPYMKQHARQFARPGIHPDDLVQDTVVDILKDLQSHVRSDENVKGYVSRIMRNRFIDLVQMKQAARRNSSRVVSFDGNDDLQDKIIEHRSDSLEQKEEYLHFMRTIHDLHGSGKLSDSRYQIILEVLNGKNFTQIAAESGRSNETIGKQFSNGIRIVKNHLEQEKIRKELQREIRRESKKVRRRPKR